ncbi:MAG: NAD(+) kinase [Synechococcaceae cyanobacterium]
MRLDRVWIILRSGSLTAQRQGHRCANDLRRQGVHVCIAASVLVDNPFPGLLATESELPDLVLVLGGDGTVLGVTRHLAAYAVPILCFNIGGNLGFLSHDRSLLKLSGSDFTEDLWTRLRQDRFALERRMMLECRVERSDGAVLPAAVDREALAAGHEADHVALNDFYFRPSLEEVSPTCLLELDIDGEVVDQYRGDGLIIATPTGSTGYAMAAGGPILHPGIEAIVVTPICPMSLSSRAVVVPPRSLLTLWPLGESGRRVKLWKDGAHATMLEPGDRALIQRSNHPALFLLLEQSPSYYRTLSRKLHWAGSLAAAEPSPN